VKNGSSLPHGQLIKWKKKRDYLVFTLQLIFITISVAEPLIQISVTCSTNVSKRKCEKMRGNVRE
jgi:hypothetical protein